MAKPPPTPPSSDIEGVHRDRVSRRAGVVYDRRAQDQLEAENEESKGRPDEKPDDKADGKPG